MEVVVLPSRVVEGGLVMLVKGIIVWRKILESTAQEDGDRGMRPFLDEGEETQEVIDIREEIGNDEKIGIEVGTQAGVDKAVGASESGCSIGFNGEAPKVEPGLKDGRGAMGAARRGEENTTWCGVVG
ncbi:unnamed protein product [Ilex paraguariensis]|uniref:Uncharacterized protein n=1 Tax=Ilex paraguariensis TaxID=185542 RepID=A0ABC8RBQ6_9AQUA